MSYDPGWDMPQNYWQQQGAFEEGSIPPTVEPDAGTQIVLGPVAQEWMPWICGALDVLRNPSNWIVADDTAMYNTLRRVDTLLGLICGQRGGCVQTLTRLQGCELQTSIDGGATWVAVPGWDAGIAACVGAQLTAACGLQTTTDGGATYKDVVGWSTYFSTCVQGIVIPPVPPLPPGETPDQQACGIADYLAHVIIEQAIVQAVNAYNQELSYLNFIQTIIPLFSVGFPLTTIGLEAFITLYRIISSGNIADFTAASTDPILVYKVRCCIYNAIKATGYTTASNYGGVSTCLHTMTYTYTSVRDAIASFWDNIGLEQIQAWQNIGTWNIQDCSDCGGNWCHTFDYTSGAHAWSAIPSYFGRIVYHQGYSGYDGGDGTNRFAIELYFTPTFIDDFSITYYLADAYSYDVRAINFWHSGSLVFQQPLGSYGGVFTVSANVYSLVDHIEIYLTDSSNLPNHTIVQSFSLCGPPGPDPFRYD